MSFIISNIVGFASGILASMGFGGGFILVVYLALFTDIAQKNAQGINLLFFIPITVIAVIIHIKNKLIDVKTALIASLFGIPAVFLGFFITNSIDNFWLRKAFAVFIIICGIKDFISAKK